MNTPPEASEVSVLRGPMLRVAAFVVTALCYGLVGSAWLAGGWLTGGWMYVPQTVMLIAVMYLIAIGADELVDAASAIARSLGVTDLVIGLTVVAFGTSAPEMAASLVAGFQGKGDITIANIVGSNVFNICFILGGVALLVKGGLKTDRDLVYRDAPVLLLGTVLLFLFVGANPWAAEGATQAAGHFWPGLLDLQVQFVEGVLLLICLSAYLFFLYRVLKKARAKKKADRTDSDEDHPPLPWGELPKLLLGLALVVGGSHLLVGQAEGGGESISGFGALWFARMWNIPDYVVGVTIVAAGTSAPEFVVSLVAAARGAFGLSAGNLLGSDIFNMFGVVGLAGVVLQPPIALPVIVSSAVVPSLLALCAVIALTIVFMRSGWRVSRFEGALLVLIGVARWTFDFVSRS